MLRDIGLIRDALITYDLDAFFKEFKHLISSIPYMNREKSESYYSSLFHIAMRVAKLHPQSEVQTHTGRIDTDIEIKNFVYIFEYKFNKTVQEAFDQIEEKKYYESYVDSSKKVILVGINFIYTDRAVSTVESAIFDIEWKAEVKKI